MNKRTSKMKSKIFTSVNSTWSFSEIFTNIISKLFFTADGAGVYPGPTYFRDFAPMPFGKRVVLLLTSIWNTSFLHFLAWLHPRFKKYFDGSNLNVHWKTATWEKKTFKNNCEGAITKVCYAWYTILPMTFSGTRNFRTLSKLSEQLVSK